MIRFEQIASRLEEEILEGRHGGARSRFMTVRELAGRFGVSLTTAHKVMNRLKAEGLLVGDSTNPAMVSPEVARRIAASDGAAPRRLGLLVTNIASPFFSNLCRHIQRVAAGLDYQVLVASSGYDFGREQRAIRSFLEIGVEGILICPGLADECVNLYRDLINQGVRLAFISRRVVSVEADSVVADSFAGGALVAGHLLNMGHKSFGYIAFTPRLRQDVRFDGYRLALLEECVDLPTERIVHADGWDVAHGYQAMARLMEGAGRPDAVFAFNDLLAIGAMQYCREHDIGVPGQVAITGFDNLPESRATSPPLTTIDYPVQSMARLAVQGLLDKVRGSGDRPPTHILLEPRLVIRQSTDPRAEAAQQLRASSEEPYGMI